MRTRVNQLLVGLAILAGTVCISCPAQAASRPNVLVITVDDMSCDSVGVYGCPVADTTPTMDAFAKTSLRFNRAHVLVGNCMPGRNLMWSGMYSHANGVEGFVPNPSPDYPVLCDLAKSAGYFAAIRGKASHSTPYSPYAWDAVLDSDPEGAKFGVKDPASYGKSTEMGIRLATEAGKPFCLMVNIADPHKPFYTEGKSGNQADPHIPTKVFAAEDVEIPGFLFDDPQVRAEVALYYSTVRRADDAVASVLAALDASGQADNTFVMFLSDHGMPLPFAKTQLYHHSTHTPLMVRWPGVTGAGTVDDEHFVSAIDFLPTLLDVMQYTHPNPDRLHGRSFANLLTGESVRDRRHVIKQYNENSGRWRQPMRAIQTSRYLYIYNPWSDGKRVFATATNGTKTARRMKLLAQSDPSIAERQDVYQHRTVEELYAVSKDPDCRKNLIRENLGAGSRIQLTVNQLRSELAAELERIGDPIAPLLRNVDDKEAREHYMAIEDERSQKARNNRKRKNGKG